MYYSTLSDLKPPESADGKLVVEVPYDGQVPDIAEVDMLVVAVDVAELVPGLAVVDRHVVVDPHPPTRVQGVHVLAIAGLNVACWKCVLLLTAAPPDLDI